MAQKVELDRVSYLFGAAGDGTDKATWDKRYEDHISKTMAKQKNSMEQTDIVSIKFELLKIVEERLDARCAKCDEKLADAMREFNAERKKLFQDALRLGPGCYDEDLDIDFKVAYLDSTLKLSRKSVDESERRIVYADSDNMSDGDGLEGFKNTAFTGVASFVAAAKKPPGEKSLFSRDAQHLFDYDDDVNDAESLPDEISTGPAGPLFRFDTRASLRNNVNNSSKYANIHQNDKADRLFNLIDLEKPEKSMTLNQLREVMLGCIDGKKTKDAESKVSGTSLLTMEHYLFEFLGQRYNSGEPEEIKEWFMALSKAISKYGMFDSDICIFGKMLRNMLAESFPDQQRVLRRTAETMIKAEAGSSVWNNRMYKGIPLHTFERVAYHMFNQKDGAEVMKRIKDPIPRTGKRGAANLEALANNSVRYGHGMEMLMTFNMNLQDDFLHDFIVAFRKIDTGKDGTLSSSELGDLIQRFGTVDSVREGSSAYTLLVDAKTSTLRNIRKSRRLNFSEAVDHFTDLLSARWTSTGKKGSRYQYHDALKASLAQSVVQESQPEQAEPDKLKSALRQISTGDKPKDKKNKEKMRANF